MIFRTTLFIGILFITHTSHSMEMEIVQEHKDLTYPKTIINELLLAHYMSKQNTLNKDIIHYILQYSIAIKNRDFNNSKHPLIAHWQDCRIPESFYHLLKPNQIDLLTEMLTCRPLNGSHSQFQARMYYHLESEKDYTLFLTLPIHLRRCFQRLPISMVQALGGEYQPINLKINPNITIQVKKSSAQIKHHILKPDYSPLNSNVDNEFFGYKPELMLPEEKNKIFGKRKKSLWH